jgi:hypothetical protein
LSFFSATKAEQEIKNWEKIQFLLYKIKNVVCVFVQVTMQENQHIRVRSEQHLNTVDMMKISYNEICDMFYMFYTMVLNVSKWKTNIKIFLLNPTNYTTFHS